jgi:hypothetical protein
MSKTTEPRRATTMLTIATPGPCTALASTLVAACDETNGGSAADMADSFRRVRGAVTAYASCAREQRVPPTIVLHIVASALRGSSLPDNLQRELRGAVADTYYAVSLHAIDA